ncbi:MAG: phage tail protein [Deltaproteobacteria bacterium]|nr:phage tail protein [Deltaproteobacteria bacterium]
MATPPRTTSGYGATQDLETEVARYNFYEGWPCKWYVPDMDSDSSGMAIEKIELAIEKMERAK